MSEQKPAAEIAAEKYANRILNTLETADARSRSFLAGVAWQKEQTRELVEALRFYADKNNWLRNAGMWRHDMIANDLDDETLTDWEGRFSGAKARAALRKFEGE